MHRSLTQADLLSSVHFESDPTKIRDETTPLLQGTISKGSRHGPRRRKRAVSVSGHGEASVTDAVLMVCLELLLLYPCRCLEYFDSY